MSNMRVTICLMQIQKLLKIEPATFAQFLKDGQTRKKGKPRRLREESTRPIMSMEYGQDMEPTTKNNRNYVKFLSGVTGSAKSRI